MTDRLPTGDMFTDSIVVFINSQGLTARGTLVSLNRSHVIFEVYNPYSIVQLSEVLREVRLTRRQKVIYTGRAMVSNLVSTGLMLIVSAALVDPWTHLEGISSPQGIRDETRRFLGDWQDVSAIDPAFVLAVDRYRGLLAEMNRWLEGTELSLGPQTGQQRVRLARELISEIQTVAGPVMDELLAEFEQQFARVDPERLQVHKEYAQRQLHPLVLVSPFVHRCYSKPLGFAGDYAMLNMLLREPEECSNTYAWLVSQQILATAPAIAYRNRIDMLVEHLVREQIRVQRACQRPLTALSVGCGPVNEVQRFLRQTAASEGCEFHLMDFNPPTIDFARGRVDETCAQTGRTIATTFIHKSIHEFLQEARRRDAQTVTPLYDLVYCAGLFDYFSDRICGRLTEMYYHLVRPGGLVIVTNVAHSRPILGYMETLMEWHLIYRSGEDMLRLCPELGEQVVVQDATGINQFLCLRKPG